VIGLMARSELRRSGSVRSSRCDDVVISTMVFELKRLEYDSFLMFYTHEHIKA
jgi:hypothetical protein